jgi:hypothetical protein
VPGALGQPLPLVDTWVWEGQALDEASERRLDDVHNSGTLPLGTDGDGMDYVLVVTGPARGQLWMLADVGAIQVADDFRAWVEGRLLPDAEWTLRARKHPRQR